jgi:lipoprotein signal peptidase
MAIWFFRFILKFNDDVRISIFLFGACSNFSDLVLEGASEISDRPQVQKSPEKNPINNLSLFTFFCLKLAYVHVM